MKTPIKLKKCKTCGLRGTFSDGSIGCSKFKIKINPEEDYCAWHLADTSITNCSLCNQSVPSKDILIYPFKDRSLLLCASCANLIGTCNTCAHSNECGFKSDRTEPQIVTRTVRQGMMTMQTQIKNPNLVKKHCINCKCSYGLEGNCCKDEQVKGCKNWELHSQYT